MFDARGYHLLPLTLARFTFGCCGDYCVLKSGAFDFRTKLVYGFKYCFFGLMSGKRVYTELLRFSASTPPKKGFNMPSEQLLNFLCVCTLALFFLGGLYLCLCNFSFMYVSFRPTYCNHCYFFNIVNLTTLPVNKKIVLTLPNVLKRSSPSSYSEVVV